MTCRHRPGDPDCSKTRERPAKKPATPDKTKYVIDEAERVGQNLVLRVTYPNCAMCSYEGNKVLVYLNVTERDVLRWREIDPHFNDKAVSPTEAPSPAARFPASPQGWQDALAYAGTKT